MNIAFVYNVRHVKPLLENKQAMDEAEFDEWSTIEGISQAIQSLGHEVMLIEADENAYDLLKSHKEKIDLVFNIAEGLKGNDREAQIPAILEMLQIPYIGSKPITQAICLDKARMKEIISYYQIATPKFQLFVTGEEEIMNNLNYPVIVKPNSEGSSKGISQDCFCQNKKELKTKIKKIIKDLQGGALLEEFLTGREFTVAIIGNEPAEVMPIVEIDFSVLPKKYFPFDSYEVKWIFDNPDSQVENIICPAKIDKKLEKDIQALCLKTKKVLNVLDFCRIDVRLDDNGKPHILEINQIPGMIPDPKENSRFPLAARKAGYSFEKMISMIIEAAMKRYKKNIA